LKQSIFFAWRQIDRQLTTAAAEIPPDVTSERLRELPFPQREGSPALLSRAKISQARYCRETAARSSRPLQQDPHRMADIPSLQFAAKGHAPIGEAVNLMYGAFGTIALIAGLGPALVAFVLDRRTFLAVLAGNRQAEATAATAQDRMSANAAPAQRFADVLGFAPLPSISAAIAVFSPLLASPVLELVGSIVKISPS
jgi:hypothetical protein